MTAAVNQPASGWQGTWIIARREIRDQFRDWRIISPIILLTLFFPLLMNFTARMAVDFVSNYGAPIIGERLIPFLLMVVGFFPISISLVIALESFAGERERLTLEPILATPLTDGQLYLGKMIASVTPPLAAAYLGISVYLIGLAINVAWYPSFQLMAQIVVLTTVQAIVMVSGAVVISSQTTSVRAANLLASFIIIPMAQLIIIESLIMFWGRYHVLWWIVLGLALVSLILIRMGMRLFNREELLGRELDVLEFRWVRERISAAFLSGARSIVGWYAGLFTETLPAVRGAVLATSIILFGGIFVGIQLAETFTIPADLLQIQGTQADLEEVFRNFGMFTTTGVMTILLTNLRALALATILGTFSFGVFGLVLLMATFSVVGYIIGNMALAGQAALPYVLGLIVPHAVFEVPAAILAGAAILQLGMAAISLPKGTTLGDGWLTALGRWAKIGLGLVLPLLVLAAIVEVYVTPRIAIMVFSGSALIP
jgi:uncharacterized membrane protein SpoIIM required for sporulation